LTTWGQFVPHFKPTYFEGFKIVLNLGMD